MLTVARLGASLAIAAACAVGCTTTTTERSPGAIVPPPPGSSPPPIGSASQTSVATVGLCAVPYDGFTLPLVSPDGRWLAVQTGVAPEWPTLLAAQDARIPMASGLEIWFLGDAVGTRVATGPSGVVLGRSADREGFLVEEMLDDGSRRIGKIAWPREAATSGVAPARPVGVEPEWLIDDGMVNAFAALGPDGSIAWCSRDVKETGFTLRVRTATAAFDIPPGPEQSWMLPVFADDGRMIFSLRYRDGVTDLVAADVASEAAFRQSLIERRLSVRMDPRRTWQVLAPQGASDAVGPGEDARLVLFDPDLRRMSVWDPATNSLRPLLERSFAAGIARDGSMLVSDQDGVVLDHPAGTAGRSPAVYDRPAIPRRVQFDGAGPSEWIFLVPDRRSIGVVRFAVVDAKLGLSQDATRFNRR
jgi:hypothetical protein